MARQARIGKRIAKSVRELREAQGLSQADLARLAKTSRSQVSLVEQGDRAPTVVTVESFARALGVQVAELLREGPRSERNLPDRALRIAIKLRERGPDYMDAVERLIGSLDRVAKKAAKGRTKRS